MSYRIELPTTPESLNFFVHRSTISGRMELHIVVREHHVRANGETHTVDANVVILAEDIVNKMLTKATLSKRGLATDMHGAVRAAITKRVKP